MQRIGGRRGMEPARPKELWCCRWSKDPGGDLKGVLIRKGGETGFEGEPKEPGLLLVSGHKAMHYAIDTKEQQRLLRYLQPTCGPSRLSCPSFGPARGGGLEAPWARSAGSFVVFPLPVRRRS